MNKIENSLAQNRAEELGYDLWDDFVIPPYYDSLDLLSAKKPRVVVGGRGCGKTSLLRYLCHQTQFSSKRIIVDESCVNNIGIYWRVDTQFAKILSSRGLDEDFWNRAFEHLSVLMMTQEILKSLESISTSNIAKFDTENLDQFDFSILSSFNPNTPQSFTEIKKFIRQQVNYFQTWAGSIRTLEQPIFLPLKFVKEIITEIKEQNILFKETTYQVYIDEYENLLPDQQRLINTWIKHSEYPLIFNLAMKPHSFFEKRTIGNEPIAETHDYREYDLENFSNLVNFEVFIAEILFLRLWKNDNSFKIPIIPEELRSTEKEVLEKRRSDSYKKNILAAAKNFLPGASLEDIAKDVFSDDILLRRLNEMTEKAIANQNLTISSNDLIFSDFPTAGIIIPALINRGISISEIKDEIGKLKNHVPNKFNGKTNWIHNNAFGSLLLIYEPLGRYCPIYSGFEAFCLMSRTNLRHFLELCYKSITNDNLKSKVGTNYHVSLKSQAEASKQASSTFLREVKNFGTEGNRLHTFVLRMGTFFKYSHKKPNQSEPEQNHFSIKGNKSRELDNFLNEAVKWSVLYEAKITKQKGGSSSGETEDFEYVLNPIYAPYFHISYRKKRSIKFSENELDNIIFGSFDDFELLLNQYMKKWKIISSDMPLNLFSQLE